MKVGIVGFGALGSQITRSLLECQNHTLELIGIYTKNQQTKTILVEKHMVKVMELEELYNASDCIIEVTNIFAMPALVRLAIEKKKPIIPMSVGGFAVDDNLLDEVTNNSTKVFIPSGGICGIDGLLALKEIGLDYVKITTIKNPKSLLGAPFFENIDYDLLCLDGPKSIYKDKARNAIKHFPSNVNIAITASCAGLGFDKTIIEIIADPTATKTTQILEAKAGECQFKAEVCGVPLAQNPKTSAVSFNSLMALLAKITSSLNVGT